MNIAIVSEDFIYRLAFEEMIKEIGVECFVYSLKNLKELHASKIGKINLILMSKEIYLSHHCSFYNYNSGVKRNHFSSVCIFSHGPQKLPPMDYIDISSSLNSLKNDLTGLLKKCSVSNISWTLIPLTGNTDKGELNDNLHDQRYCFIAHDYNVDSAARLNARALHRPIYTRKEMQEPRNKKPKCLFRPHKNTDLNKIRIYCILQML